MIVPNGHVMLNFTEIRLSGERFSNDQVKIYDGNTTSEGARLDYFEGRTPVVVPAWFIGSSNIITVTFYSGKVDVSKRTYRFKALYTMNTQGMSYFVWNIKCKLENCWQSSSSLIIRVVSNHSIHTFY